MMRSEYDDIEPGDQVLVESRRGLSVADLPPVAYENLLVVSTTRTPQKIETAVREGGGNPADVGLIPVSGSDPGYSGPLWTADRVDPSDLTGLSMRLSDAARYLEPGVGWVVVDNLTVLFMYTPEERLYRLLSSVISSFRRRELHSVYGVVRTAMGDETYSRFRGLFDDEIQG